MDNKSNSIVDKLKGMKDKIKSGFDNMDKKMKKQVFISVGGVVVAVAVIFGVTQYREAKEAGTSKVFMSTENRIKLIDELGQSLYYDGNYNEAIKKYEILNEKDSENPKWIAEIAKIYSVKGDIEKSQEYVEKALEYSEISPDVINNIVFTQYINGYCEKAIVVGEDGLEKYPENKNLIKTMYLVYMDNNEVEKAINLVKSYPVDYNLSYDVAEYARLLMVIGEKEKGYEMLKKAWDIDKDELKIFDVISQIAVYDDKNEILEDIAILSQENPDDAFYKLCLAKIYSLSVESSEMAIDIINQLENKDTGEIELKFIEAYSYLNLQEYDKADEIMQEIINSSDEDYRTLHLASVYYLKKDDIQNALKYSEKSIEVNPRYTDNYSFVMPDILKKQGKEEVEKVFFRTALELEPYNYNIMLSIANYWESQNDLSRALSFYQLADIVNPNDAEIKYKMVTLHLIYKSSYLDNSNQHKQEGQDELAQQELGYAAEEEQKAIDLLNECIDLTKDVPIPKYHRTLGTILMLQGKYEEAYEQIHNAYAADEADVLNLYNAGVYYYTIGNVERGYYNFFKAYEGLNDSYDQYVIDIINENYKKASDLYHQWYDADDNAILEVPDFEIFY